MSARCTRRRVAHRVGAAGYSSTFRTTLSTRSAHRECSKNYKAKLGWRKNYSLRLILILTALLIVVGVMAVLVLRATTHPGGSSAAHATGEGGSYSSSSSISQLPRTGGP